MTIVDFIRQFPVNSLLLVEYYRYKSYATDRLFTVEEHTFQEDFPQNFEEISTYFKDFKDKFLNTPIEKEPIPHNCWDNKIVIKVKTKDGGYFFIGWFDGYWSIGLSRDGDSYIEPLYFINN